MNNHVFYNEHVIRSYVSSKVHEALSKDVIRDIWDIFFITHLRIIQVSINVNDHIWAEANKIGFSADNRKQS